MFGMKEAKRRPTTNKGTQNGHAYFESWKDCVIDYAFYQAAYLNSLKTEDQYYQYLSASYAEDPNYVTKVRQMANSLK
jgi:flagellum-specific peptidoglycan hydrolase FlgJ